MEFKFSEEASYSMLNEAKDDEAVNLFTDVKFIADRTITNLRPQTEVPGMRIF